MSISGGLARAIERAAAVEATALQVFVKSARQWAAPPLETEDVEAFRDGLRRQGLERYTLAHSAYLINLASPDDAVRERSIEALAVELGRCDRLGIPYLVLHPGSHVGSGEETGLRRVAQALDRLLSRSGEVTVLLENTAGQGSNLGHRFEHLGTILDSAESSDRLGVCFDTCHALAAGYELAGAASYERTFAELDRTIGLERLRAFHLNDSKFGPGSRRDRHEHIGEGQVGLDGFRRLVNDGRFREIPMVLETPKGEDLAEDRRNLSVLRSLAGEARS